MATKFCLTCGSYLQYVTIEKRIYKKCDMCNVIESIDDDIISEYNYDDTSNVITSRIAAMIIDPHTYSRIEKKMPDHEECKNNIIKYYRFFETMKVVYVCEKCKRYWLT